MGFARQFFLEGAALSAPGRSGWVEIDVTDRSCFGFSTPPIPGGDGAPPSRKN
jgi:hypothetical protein